MIDEDDFTPRGTELPQAKLTESDVAEIWRKVKRRDELKRQLAKLTNAALADAYGVHTRTIDRVTAGRGWTHVVA